MLNQVSAGNVEHDVACLRAAREHTSVPLPHPTSLAQSVVCERLRVGLVPHSGSFFRRESRANANEMIISRLTDRPLRPMLPKGWAVETQVLSWVLSYDGQHQTEPLAITSAGAALALSGALLPASNQRITCHPPLHAPRIKERRNKHPSICPLLQRQCRMLWTSVCAATASEKTPRKLRTVKL